MKDHDNWPQLKLTIPDRSRRSTIGIVGTPRAGILLQPEAPALHPTVGMGCNNSVSRAGLDTVQARGNLTAARVQAFNISVRQIQYLCGLKADNCDPGS